MAMQLEHDENPNPLRLCASKGWHLWMEYRLYGEERALFARKYINETASVIKAIPGTQRNRTLFFVKYIYPRQNEQYAVIESVGVFDDLNTAKYHADVRAGLVRRRLPCLFHG